MPIEVVDIGNVSSQEIDEAISIANPVQDEFEFLRLNEFSQQAFKTLAYKKAFVKDLFDDIENIRSELRGYHPFLISIINAKLEGKVYNNLFGSHRGRKGLALISCDNVENYIIPEGKMISYFLYYFARYTISFIIPDQKNHLETKDCIFDNKVYRPDIKRSMKSGAICDECRKEIISSKNSFSSVQFAALDKIFEISGNYLKNSEFSHDLKTNKKQTVFNEAFLELSVIKDNLVKKAKKDVKINLWLYLITLFIMWAILIFLTYKFGWDKLEPWTYFIGGLITLGIYTYFVVTQKEFSPKIIYDQVVENKIRKIYQKFGFDITKYKTLKENQ